MTSLLWDQHACLPLQPDTDVDQLTRYQRRGGAFVSVNAGYSPHSFDDTMLSTR
jgi:membrane dipeptidase